MTKKKSVVRTCIGFAEYEGICENMPSANPYWCNRCNKLRMKHLDKRFNELNKVLKIDMEVQDD